MAATWKSLDGRDVGSDGLAVEERKLRSAVIEDGTSRTDEYRKWNLDWGGVESWAERAEHHIRAPTRAATIVGNQREEDCRTRWTT